MESKTPKPKAARTKRYEAALIDGWSIGQRHRDTSAA